ncbi:hypothetical protein [Paractinoplanes durhamensis]|uniref:DUF416 family protein n=1 Tax=Paractinoplanes durhamensis TaxID=113563 RepID=A0ABQ3Z307_9ACTN|nr:hypothetical protein [Actinoplanes durhamensis]GIE04218.1 hypothetical protein Adu01nite_55680 [Actinoplanes durhamensis]
MVLKFDRAGVADSLTRIDQDRAVAFTAACVQRRKPGVDLLPDQGRQADLATFETTLADLWAVAAGDLAASERSWDGLDNFAELQSEEEAEGALAFGEDAVAALWYATKLIRDDNREFGVHCASRCVDSAGFLDDLADDSADFADNEIRLQSADLDDLTRPGTPITEVISRLRERAAGEATRTASAIADIDDED